MKKVNKPLWILLALLVVGVLAVLFSEMIVLDSRTDNLGRVELEV